MTLNDIKKQIKKLNLDALYINRNNMFLGQDILDEENIILELTGFSGSSGDLIITDEKTYLFTDGRYELQAKEEVNISEVEVFTESTDLFSFLRKYKKDEKREIKIGYNPWTLSIEQFERLKNISIYNREDCPLGFVETDLIKYIKKIKQPKVFEIDTKFAGKSAEEKIEALLKDIEISRTDAYLITAADSVSWLLNLRSDYLPNSPIFRAYALVDKEKKVTVFTDDTNQLANLKVVPLSDIEKELKIYKKYKINFDRKSPIALKNIADKHGIEATNFFDPCAGKKAIKNKVEIKGFKNSHIRDGIAITKFLYWLESNWKNKTELDIVEKVLEFRKNQKFFFSNSFDTIAATGPNGAIVHYHPNKKNNSLLKDGSLLLLDSGGQYFDGTTDVTRTVLIGSNPTKEMKLNYTLVLKAHIALANTKFLKDTNGIRLDAIARKPLWEQGKDYKHGTGHGVGFFLNVHEGPNSISTKDSYYPLQENMITSIEPGYYKEGKYGIRLESLYRVVKCKDKKFENEILKFDCLTLVPFDKKLINFKILSKEEIFWLEKYNKIVFNALSSFLDKDEVKWLRKRTI